AFDSFASAVLGPADEGARTTLKSEMEAWHAYRTGLMARNATPVRFGWARLDAVGYILNKVAHTLSPDQSEVWFADAPVSYPFIWNASQHDRLQWNGIAENRTRINIGGNATDIGGLGRNAGQVIGVFAGMELEPGGLLSTRIADTSVRIDNIIRLERVLSRLHSPVWPEALAGEIDRGDIFARGRALYDETCLACHARLAPDDVESPITASMQPIFAPQAGTDPLMACNAILHRSESGPLEGAEFRYFPSIAAANIGEAEPTSKLLSSLILRTIIKRRDDLIEVLAEDTFQFFGAGDDPVVVARGGPPTPDPLIAMRMRKAAMVGTCRDLVAEGNAANVALLQYKARPLNGIWATAPYLHNGSVPTLYDLLLPPDDRPTTFGVNARLDTDKVGIDGTTDGAPFVFNVLAEDGQPLPGNSNAGHVYGTDFTEADRRALVEYLKSL
ncbi:MAG: di-heme-cytochrome C peroxidase, partial [Pseudomonadota bacterium]